VPSSNARKAKWHQIHRVGAWFGIVLHSKKAEKLSKITQQCDKVDIGWRHRATRPALHEHDAVRVKFNNSHLCSRR
jgi:hypothetical protein